ADLLIIINSLGRIQREDGGFDMKDRFIVEAQIPGKDSVLVGGGRIHLLSNLDAFLQDKYSELGKLGRRGLKPAAKIEDQVTATAAVQQFGADLWKQYIPDVLKAKIRQLQKLKPSGADIRLQTNDPRLPLELLLVPRNGEGDCTPPADC